jgi:prepilin-type N-terminal cleavage/methylation domain-containing protein
MEKLNLESDQKLLPHSEGFSLLEILIALTIMGFLSISLFTITNNNIDTKEIIIKEDREYLQVYTALHRLDSDFSQIYSPLYFSSLELSKDKDANDAAYSQSRTDAKYKYQVSENFPTATVNIQPVPLVTQEDKTSLRFLTAANKRFFEDQKQSRHAWVEYYLARDDREDLATAEFQLMRRKVNTNIYDRDLDFRKVKGHVLLRGVKEFKLEFYSREREKWVDSIKLLNESERYTPRSLRVTLTWVDTEKQEQTQIRIFRPYWPYFDVVADETERQASKKPKTPNQNPNGGPR